MSNTNQPSGETPPDSDSAAAACVTNVAAKERWDLEIDELDPSEIIEVPEGDGLPIWESPCVIGPLLCGQSAPIRRLARIFQELKFETYGAQDMLRRLDDPEGSQRDLRTAHTLAKETIVAAKASLEAQSAFQKETTERHGSDTFDTDNAIEEVLKRLESIANNFEEIGGLIREAYYGTRWSIRDERYRPEQRQSAALALPKWEALRVKAYSVRTNVEAEVADLRKAFLRASLVSDEDLLVPKLSLHRGTASLAIDTSDIPPKPDHAQQLPTGSPCRRDTRVTERIRQRRHFSWRTLTLGNRTFTAGKELIGAAAPQEAVRSRQNANSNCACFP